MPRVFITNDSGQDYSKAEKFGELVRVTVGPQNIFQPDRIRHDILNQLAKYEFDEFEDFILVAGAALPCALLFALVALQRSNEVLQAALIGQFSGQEKMLVKCLLFDGKKQDYVLRTVAL